MKFNLSSIFTFSSDIFLITKELEKTISDFNNGLLEKDKSIKIDIKNIKENKLKISIFSEGVFRPHNALLQLKNKISSEFGKKHHLGIRSIKIDNYTIDFDLDKEPLKELTIPFAKVIVNSFNGSLSRSKSMV
jgi:hypothetical protein